MAESREKKLIKNSFLFVISEISTKLILFLLTPFYTAVLSNEQFGISDLLTTTVTLTTPFFTIVITEAVMRFALDKESDNNDVFSIGLYTTIIGSLILGVLSYFVFPFITILKDYWFFFIVYFFAYNFYGLLSNFTKGLNRVKPLALVGIANTLILVLLNILFLIKLKMGIKGYLLASIIATGLSSVVLFFAIKAYLYIKWIPAINKRVWNDMFRYSFPMIPNSAMWWINNSSDRYIVTYLVSSAANGIYSVAYRIPSIFSVIMSVFMQAWQISVVDDFGTKEGTSFFNRIYSLFIRANIVLCASIVITSKIIGRLIFLGTFFDAWKYSVALIIGYSFHSLAGFLGTIYTSVKKTRQLFTSTAIAAIINIVLNIVLIKTWLGKGPFFATMGAAVATIISYFISYIIRRVKAKKYIKLNVNTGLYVFEFIIVCLMALLMILDNKISIITSVILYILIIVLNFNVIIEMTKTIRRKVLNK